MTYLQVEPMGELLKVGGILSVVLAIGVIALWRENIISKKALQDLNDSIRKDAAENIKIIDSLNNTINNKVENDGKIFAVVNETLILLKTHLTKEYDKSNTRNNQNA